MPIINIAVTGCGHGELDTYYRMCEVFEKKGKKIDLLIITGDFQAMRNQEDLGCMKCPIKYKHMMDFFMYYSGEKKAPVLTIYAGGNHEATNYQRELHYGGWVAPNIYFMGCSNIIRFKGLSIGGISGIWKSNDYERGYYETVPFSNDYRAFDSAIASSYHYRHLEITKLLSYTSSVDIMISHDWPSRMFQYGDTQSLLRKKPHFIDDINNMCLGSIPLMSVLNELKPAYWFSSHLHVKYAAVYPHSSVVSPTNPVSPQESENSVQEISRPASANDGTTHFLSLDKCINGRDFMQVIEIEVASDMMNDENLYYDPEWLAIIKQSHCYLSTSRNRVMLPDRISITEATQEMINDAICKAGGDINQGLVIKSNFQQIAPIYYGFSTDSYTSTVAVRRGNNQTDEYLKLLGVEHVVTIPLDREIERKKEIVEDPNMLDIDDLFGVSCHNKQITTIGTNEIRKQ